MGDFTLKGASGTVAGQQQILGELTLIGSSENCDLVVARHAVAPRHAEIAVRKDRTIGIRAIAAGAEVFVNGVAGTNFELASGDEIRIADCRWVLQAPGLRPDRKLRAAGKVESRRTRWWAVVVATAIALIAAYALWRLGYIPFPRS